MVKIQNATKMLAASVLISMAALLPVSVVHADTPNLNYPNTKVCMPNDVTKSSNGGTFNVKWDNGTTFTINVTTTPLSDITLYASSYHLTSDLYKGGCFSHDPNTGTSPQTYDGNTQTLTLKAGVTGSQTVTLAMPDNCYNEQADLYFGDSQGNPLNGTVTSAGHDNYGFIAGGIMLTANNPACAPGKGGGPTTPTTPQVLSATTTVVPTLTNTGMNIRFTGVLATALLTAAAYVFTRRNKVSE